MALLYSNNARTFLNENIADSDTEFDVVDASVFPAISSPDYMYMTLENASDTEIVKVTNITGNTLTVTRAQDDTSAAAFSTGARAEGRITKGLLNDLLSALATGSASGISYDNASSGLTAEDVQDAIDELVALAGIASLAEDTSPQLGGALDTNSQQVKLSKGADVASASALTLGADGNFFNVTGTTSVTSIGTLGIGTVVRLHFTGALTLTHHATDLILPGGSSITTAAGDTVELIEYASGDWLCLRYTKATPTLLESDVSSNLTVGFTSDVYDYGNTGTTTQEIDHTQENLQTMGLTGSCTINPDSSASGISVILLTVDATGGYTVTLSGWSFVVGTPSAWAADEVYKLVAEQIGSYSVLTITKVSA